MIENNDESKKTLIGRKKEELRRWVLKPLWSEEEFQSLCCGMCPGGSPGARMRLAWDEALEIIRRSVAVNELSSIYRRATFFDAKTDLSGRFFKPDDAVRWALSTGLFPKFPFSLADLPPSQNDMADEKHEPANASNEVHQDTLGGRERTTHKNSVADPQPQLSRNQGAETKKRDSLLVIIAALAKQAQIDLMADDAVSRIQGCVSRVGATASNGTVRTVINDAKDSIPEILKLIPAALDRRAKTK